MYDEIKNEIASHFKTQEAAHPHQGVTSVYKGVLIAMDLAERFPMDDVIAALQELEAEGKVELQGVGTPPDVRLTESGQSWALQE